MTALQAAVVVRRQVYKRNVRSTLCGTSTADRQYSTQYSTSCRPVTWRVTREIMGGLARFALVRVLAASTLIHAVTPIGTRVTFLREPSPSYVRNFLDRQQQQKTPFNHDFAGFTDPVVGTSAAPPPPPPGFSERTVRVRLGEGRTIYTKGRDVLLQWRMHDGSSWARIVLGRRLKWWSDSQVQMATVAKACAGLAWCINPCQVLYERNDKTLTFSVPPGTNPCQPWEKHQTTFLPLENTRITAARNDPSGISTRLWAGGSPKDAPAWASFRDGGGSKGVQSAVAYATKEGHLIQGEERMRVVWFRGRGGDDSVWFEVYSVSRGSGIIGAFVFPFVRSMQKRFFREQAETVRCIVTGRLT